MGKLQRIIATVFLVGDEAWVTGYYGHPRGKLTIPKKLDEYENIQLASLPL